MSIKQKIIMHADDFGLSKEVSGNILECLNFGTLNSVGAICTSKEFLDCIRLLKDLKQTPRISLHINLTEGFPISKRNSIPLLLNKSGEFRFSFLTLWLFYVTGSIQKRIALIRQIEHEILNQIHRFQNALLKFDLGNSLQIDSHRHFHMLPFIQDILININKNHKIDYIRVPYEIISGKMLLKECLSTNLIKMFLLKRLSIMLKKKLSKSRILYNSSFVGVLFTGKMNLEKISELIRMVKKTGLIEVLIHPGGVYNVNNINWTTKRSFMSYYKSEDRVNEKKVLLSDEMRKFLNNIGTSIK
jgi:predicted glycoside hydrolase/deacetylase ChbG (UPF0249 family)